MPTRPTKSLSAQPNIGNGGNTKLGCRNPGAWPLWGTAAAAKTRYTQVADHRSLLLRSPCPAPRPPQSQLRRPRPPTSAELYSAKVVSLMGRTIKKAKSKKTKVPYRTLLFLES